MRTVRYGILPFAGVLLVVVALLVMEPHFSAAIIIIAIGAVMLFLGGVRLYWFVGALVAAGAALGVVMTFFPYASSRISTVSYTHLDVYKRQTWRWGLCLKPREAARPAAGPTE